MTSPSGAAHRGPGHHSTAAITAALTFSAAGCRAGHRGATSLAATDSDLQRQWSDADPTEGIPAVMFLTHSGEPPPDSDLFLAAKTMQAHLASHDAVPLSKT